MRTRHFDKFGPEDAKKLLAGSDNFRSLSSRRVEAMARDIVNGYWEDNGIPLIVGIGGKLLDGQTRCHAVIKADRYVPMMVIYDVESVQEVNTGQGRTLSQLLKNRGQKNHANLAALVRAAAMWDSGANPAFNCMVTNSEMLDWFDKHQDVLGTMQRFASFFEPGLPKSLVQMIYYIGKRNHPEAAEDFADAFHHPEKLQNNDPVMLLRKRVLRDRPSRMERKLSLALLIKVWNSYVRGESLGVLRWSDVGPQAQQFPEML